MDSAGASVEQSRCEIEHLFRDSIKAVVQAERNQITRNPMQAEPEWMNGIYVREVSRLCLDGDFLLWQIVDPPTEGWEHLDEMVLGSD